DLPALNMHMLVCGATGSGKTNTLANLIRAAQSLGACCLVFDHKPDYQDVDAPNTELDEAAWASFATFGLGPRALAQSHFYGLAGQDRRQLDEEQFAVWASDVEPEMLAAAIFPSRSDDNQRDLFLAISEAYKAAHDGGRTHWSLADVNDWLSGLAHD